MVEERGYPGNTQHWEGQVGFREGREGRVSGGQGSKHLAEWVEPRNCIQARW